jgi:prepilin-type N-terminal cleavage/methylation domain-containing protein
MKLFSKNQTCLRASRTGFTLPEILITSTIFVTLVTVGMIAVQLFGIRYEQLSQAKLVATADSLRTLSQFRDQIRGASQVQIGTFSSSSPTFVTNANGTSQIGNAVQVYPSTNTTQYLIFYRDTVNTNLYYVTNNQSVTTSSPGFLLARWVSNTNCFQAEDTSGKVLTNVQNNCAIHMTLQFFEKLYVFSGNPTNYYYLDTRASPRAPNVIN